MKPLVVDLDNTLLRTDLLAELLPGYLVRNPLALPRVIGPHPETGQIITASITEEAIAELGLTPGDRVVAIVKASDVLIGK